MKSTSALFLKIFTKNQPLELDLKVLLSKNKSTYLGDRQNTAVQDPINDPEISQQIHNVYVHTHMNTFQHSLTFSIRFIVVVVVRIVHVSILSVINRKTEGNRAPASSIKGGGGYLRAIHHGRIFCNINCR